MADRLQDDGWAVNAAAKAMCAELGDDWGIGARYWTHVAHRALAAVDQLTFGTAESRRDAAREMRSSRDG